MHALLLRKLRTQLRRRSKRSYAMSLDRKLLNLILKLKSNFKTSMTSNILRRLNLLRTLTSKSQIPLQSLLPARCLRSSTLPSTRSRHLPGLLRRPTRESRTSKSTSRLRRLSRQPSLSKLPPMSILLTM